ncbi:hypothetical protein KCP69_25145 [Salmonella enterica subsp. enterica]|nr:hypothetical protein KCP69_25145 [Salmonella enterica subsp. enterica]
MLAASASGTRWPGLCFPGTITDNTCSRSLGARKILTAGDGRLEVFSGKFYRAGDGSRMATLRYPSRFTGLRQRASSVTVRFWRCGGRRYAGCGATAGKRRWKRGIAHDQMKRNPTGAGR